MHAVFFFRLGRRIGIIVPGVLKGMRRWESQASLVSLPLFPISYRRLEWSGSLFSFRSILD